MFAEDAEESVYIVMWFLVMVLWSMVDDDSVEHDLCLSLFQAAEDDVAPCSHIAKLYCKKQNPFSADSSRIQIISGRQTTTRTF